jgi:tetratricopeptide (TPR) repeat protein
MFDIHGLCLNPLVNLHTAVRIWIAVFSISLCAAAQTNPTEAARLNNLGAGYMNQQAFEKGLHLFEQASKLDPNLQIAKLNQGIALLNIGELDPAQQILETTAKENPKDPYAWYNLGLLYKNSNSPDRAVDAFLHVIEIDSADPDVWYFLGSVYAQLKQFPQAIDSYNHALKLNPYHASSQFGLARAYQQSGDQAKAKEDLERFQYITQKKLGTPISLAYGEQGKYSLAEQSAATPPKVLPQIPVRFADVTAEAGLSSKSLSKANDLAGSLGPGACVFDYDGDGKPDIFLADNGPQGGMALYHNLGNAKFEDVTKKAGLDPSLHAIACTAGDYDNDGATDLAISTGDRVMLLHNEKNGKFKDVTREAGITSEGPNAGLLFVDYDHDGDLDLYIARAGAQTPLLPELDSAGRNVMWRNDGNGIFTNVTSDLGVTDSSFSAIGSDYNNDRAVDLIAPGPRKSAIILENPREGKFIAESPWSSKMRQPANAVAVLDFNHDDWMDVAFTHFGQPSITLWRNNKDQSFDNWTFPTPNWARAFGLAALDYDNDGWVDLAAVGETKDGKGEVRLFRNLGPDGWKDVTADVGLDKIILKDPRSIATADFDGDGTTDLLITQNHGPAVLLKNVGANKNHWLRLSLKGLNDNKSAIGTKVEVFSGGNRQKYEIYGSNGYLGQNSTDIVIGLGQEKQADVVRMLWPTGVLQDEVEIAADQPESITEIDRRGSSCPTLFAWDGKAYTLVADMLGAGAIGHWVATNERNIARPVEYVKLDRSLQPKDGKLSFRFMEPLEEAVYLDRLRLLAVDHPAALNVYPNEYFASNPPYPPFKVIFSRDAHPPVAAVDDHGHDVLPNLLAHNFIGDFKVLQFSGFTEPHSLELDLGKDYDGGPLWLLMHGEIEYFTATSMYAASQAGLEPIAPYVEALNAESKWVRIIDDLGFPAGGPRTMTADLSGKLPIGARHLRITTNLQIYWDSILISRTKQDQPAQVTDVPLARADLDFHGFPRKIENQPPGNVAYIYEQTSATGPYTRPAGNYTRYGDVLPLLTNLDDRLAVFGSGDEIKLDFDPSNLPPVPSGWTRDYFFAAEGYEKDMDFYAFDFDRVTPLPYAAMKNYPPQQMFPLDASHLDYLLEYNTRYMSGHEPPGFAFDYPK